MGCGPTGEGVLLGGSDGGVELHVCTLLSEEDDQGEDQGKWIRTCNWRMKVRMRWVVKLIGMSNTLVE